MRVCAVVPVYNTGDRLHDVLSNILRFIPAHNVVVVDDGSTDDSLTDVDQLGVSVLCHGENRGKGEALRSGFQYVIREQPEAVFTLDGDGQHDPGHIPSFIRTMESTTADIVIGYRRFHRKRMPLDRIGSNGLCSLITSFMTGTRIKDSQCGYRLIRAEVIRALTWQSEYYEAETEFLIRALWRGFHLQTCPIDVRYSGESSHIRRWTDSVRFCRMIVRLICERSGL